MRVLIAARQASLRSALKILIQTRPRIEIVAMAENKEELLHILEATRPDLLLLDEDLDEATVDTIMVQVRKFDPNLAIMILGQRSELQAVYLEAGAAVYLTKDGSPKRLLTAIEEVRLQSKYV